MTIKTLLPELNDNQLQALERLISEEVIGEKSKTFNGIPVSELTREAQLDSWLAPNVENRLRAEQRKALTALLWGSEEQA